MRSLLLVVALCGSASADWPMGGRTPDRNAVSPEKNPPIAWDIGLDGARPVGIKWATQFHRGMNVGGPVVAGGFVWVGTVEDYDEGKKDDSILAAVRVTDGKVVYWYRSPRRGGRNVDWPGQSLSGSPLVDGNRLWFVTNQRKVVCLDIAPLARGEGDPREVWSFDLRTELKVHPKALHIGGFDTYGSPAAHKHLLFVPTGNGVDFSDGGLVVPSPGAPSLVCLNRATGKLVWSDNSPGKEIMSGQSCSPLVVTTGGRTQVIHPQGDGWVRSFDAETGKLLWKFDLGPADEGRAFSVAVPVFAGGRVFVATGRDRECCFGSGRLVCLDPTKTGDVSAKLPDGKPNATSAVAWEFTRCGPADSDRMHQTLTPVVVHDDLVVATDIRGHVHCLDEKTGRRHWVHDTKSSIVAPALVADGKVFVGTEDGFLFVLALRPVKAVLAKHEFDGPISAPPVFAGGVLYVLSWSKLFAITRPR